MRKDDQPDGGSMVVTSHFMLTAVASERDDALTAAQRERTRHPIPINTFRAGQSEALCFRHR